MQLLEAAMSEKHSTIPSPVITGEGDSNVFDSPTMAQLILRKERNYLCPIMLILSGLAGIRPQRRLHYRCAQFWPLSASTFSKNSIE